MYKNHKKNKIWTTINKFLAYYAYDLFSFLFYILVIIKLIFFLGVEKNLNHEVMLIDIISISLSISSIIIFIFTIFTIIYGVIIKHFWERKYERDTISFVEQNFSEFFEEYMYARKFSKKHKFTIYFKPKLKKVHRNKTPININKPDKYLSPFSTVKFRKWKHNQ